MSGFLYFFPDKAAIGTLAEIPPECNLGHLEGAVHFRSVLSGPGGRNGIVLSVKDERIGYYPEKQEWTEVVDSAGAITHWIGFDRRIGRLPMIYEGRNSNRVRLSMSLANHGFSAASMLRCIPFRQGI